ncbi:MAG: hypothetical protein M3Y59_24530 [Myxococcota bacterium]|nr:hypothetical protein [Myxococcota bacterium]
MSQQIGIRGMGMAVPPQVRTNDWWPEEFRRRFEEKSRGDVTTPEVFTDRAKTPAQRIQFQQMLETYHDPFRGSRQRRIAEAGVKPSQLQIAAARQALERAGIDAVQLDVVLESSMPSDVPNPSNSGALIHGLGAKRAHGVSFDAGCSSFISGLALAEAMIRAGQARYVLLAHVGMLSRICDWNDPLSVNNGDGAGAVVVGPMDEGQGLLAHVSVTKGDLYDGMLVGPRGEEFWTEGKSPIVMQSRNLQAGRAIVLGTADFAKETIEIALRRAGVEKEQVTRFYSHQPSVFFNASSRLGAGLVNAQTTDTFARYASMHAANIPINLCEAQQAGQLQRGDLCVFYACGTGLNLAAAVYRWQ